MRRRKKITNHSSSGSMADIAFLLLIFFMVATSLQKEKSIPMKLPPAYDGPIGKGSDSQVLSIDINANNEILIEGRESDLSNAPQLIIQELEDILAKTQSPIIALRLHQDANYASYMTLLSLVKKTMRTTKENVAQSLYNTPLLELSRTQHTELNKRFTIKISETEYKITS